MPNMLRHTSRATARPINPPASLPLSASCHDSRLVLTMMAATMPTQIAS